MNKSLKVGVVGAGHMGSYHVRLYSELLNVELIGIADINEKQVNRLAEQYHTVPYTDYTKLYDKVDAVSIAVPTGAHYRVGRDFLEAGIHVLIEKPITNNIEEAQGLIKLAREKGLILQVGHVERFNAAVLELKKIVKDPIFIECRRLGPYNRRINDTGVVLDLLIHDIDIVLGLVNSSLKEINVAAKSIYSEYEDIANVQLVFDNGCIASLTASRVTEDKIRTLAVTQSNAYIILDYAEQDLHIYRQGTSEYIISREAVGYKQESFIERIFVHKDNPLKLQLVHFVDCVSKGIPPMTSFEAELKALAVTLQIQDKLKL
ncbi:MAG: Gfo/Idh/MocA family oxidoreductase [Nitrospirota bacterium]